MIRLAVTALLLAGCGGDGGGGGMIDAAKMPDSAPVGTVMTVTCPGTPDATITVTPGGGAYMPMATTVPVNAVIRFQMTPTHDAKPNTLTMTDPGIQVGFGETKCLKFTATGTFGFFCTAHSFAGTVTVQ
jgi:plastocyanin